MSDRAILVGGTSVGGMSKTGRRLPVPRRWMFL